MLSVPKIRGLMRVRASESRLPKSGCVLIFKVCLQA